MKEFIEKLIGRLEEELKLADEVKEKCARENPLMFDNAKGYSTGIANAKSFVNQLAEEYQTIDVAELVDKFGQKKVRSNAERIRAMSDEELHDFIRAVRCCTMYGDDCGYPFCHSMNGNLCNGIKDSRNEELLKWLQSEAQKDKKEE